MTQDQLKALAALFRRERAGIIDEWRRRVRALPSAQDLERPQVENLVPTLVDEIAEAIASRKTQAILRAQLHTAPYHGKERLHAGFDLVEVVFEYSALRDCMHDLAEARDMSLTGESRKILDRVIDGALAAAAQQYVLERAAQVKDRRSEYLSFVAHDLKTPLSAIANAGAAVKLMCMQTGRHEELEAMIENILHNVNRLDTLIGEILHEEQNIADADLVLDKQDVPLRPLVEEVLENLNAMSEKGNTTVLNEIPASLVAKADADLLRRLFENLLANAFRHADSAIVMVGAGTVEKGDTVACWVTDKGTGISEERTAQLLKEREAGALASGEGLGLAIARRIVAAHGGTLSIQSKVGEGATFAFTLPLWPYRA